MATVTIHHNAKMPIIVVKSTTSVSYIVSSADVGDKEITRDIFLRAMIDLNAEFYKNEGDLISFRMTNLSTKRIRDALVWCIVNPL